LQNIEKVANVVRVPAAKSFQVQGVLPSDTYPHRGSAHSNSPIVSCHKYTREKNQQTRSPAVAEIADRTAWEILIG